MTKFIRATLLVASLIFIAPLAHAAVTPLAVSIVPPVQFPPDDFTITGIRASVLWGHHRDLYGIDLGGVGNITDQRFAGIALSGIFNVTRGDTTIIGLQAAGLLNYNSNKTNVYGVQIAAIANVNTAEASMNGLQVALANISDNTTVRGAQFGLYNTARTVEGFQIGVINKTENLHGIQIGLLNFNHTGVFKVAPILNVGF